jgi:hypothetical protein
MTHGHGVRLQSTSTELTGDEDQGHTEAPFHVEVPWNRDSKTCKGVTELFLHRLTG